jgi:hypothetical protein
MQSDSKPRLHGPGPVRIVVGFRWLLDILTYTWPVVSKALGQPVVVDSNKPGASGSYHPADLVAKARTTTRWNRHQRQSQSAKQLFPSCLMTRPPTAPIAHC